MITTIWCRMSTSLKQAAVFSFNAAGTQACRFLFLTLIDTSRNSAPSDSTCSLTDARVSNARTIAPMFLA